MGKLKIGHLDKGLVVCSCISLIANFLMIGFFGVAAGYIYLDGDLWSAVFIGAWAALSIMWIPAFFIITKLAGIDV